MTIIQHSDEAALSRASWGTCDHCGAPMDEAQRYCVECGVRRADADDPATAYFQAAARRARGAAPSAPAHVVAPPRSGALALAVALLPLAAGIGLLVGRGGGGEDRIVEALRAQKAPIVNVTGAVAGATTGTAALTTDRDGATAKPKSTFPLASGYAVALRTLPAGATAAQVAAAVTALEGKGAEDVTVAGPKDFRVTPGGAGYVLVSGAFPTKAKAAKARKALAQDFPEAAVVRVRARRGGAKPVARTSDGAEILATGPAGSARKLTGTKPSAKQLQESAAAVERINEAKGKDYVESQRNLPDQIVIP
jgi:hypothetical protein